MAVVAVCLFIYVILCSTVSKFSFLVATKQANLFVVIVTTIAAISLPEVELCNCKSTWWVGNWHWWPGWWSQLLYNVPWDKFQHVSTESEASTKHVAKYYKQCMMRRSRCRDLGWLSFGAAFMKHVGLKDMRACMPWQSSYFKNE